jgi:hypothetical protein
MLNFIGWIGYIEIVVEPQFGVYHFSYHPTNLGAFVTFLTFFAIASAIGSFLAGQSAPLYIAAANQNGHLYF